MALFDIKNVTAALKAAPDDVKKKAADMIAQFGEQPIAPDAVPATYAPGRNAAELVTPDILQQMGQSPEQGNFVQPSSQSVDQGSIAPDFAQVNTQPRQAPIVPQFGIQRGGEPLSLDDRVNTAETRYADAVNAPVPKAKWWKDLLAIGGAVASNVANPRNQVEVKGWNRLKHDKNIQRALAELQPLEQLQKIGQDRVLKNAQILDTLAKPGDRDIEAQRKADKDAVDAEYKDNLIGLGKFKADNIKTYREQIVELRHRGADQADKRIKALNDRIEEEKRHNKATETLGAQNYNLKKADSDALNAARTYVNGLHAQELALKQQQSTVKNATDLAKLQMDMATLQQKQSTLRQQWATKIGTGGFSQEMYDEMFPPE